VAAAAVVYEEARSRWSMDKISTRRRGNRQRSPIYADTHSPTTARVLSDSRESRIVSRSGLRLTSSPRLSTASVNNSDPLLVVLFLPSISLDARTRRRNIDIPAMPRYTFAIVRLIFQRSRIAYRHLVNIRRRGFLSRNAAVLSFCRRVSRSRIHPVLEALEALETLEDSAREKRERIILKLSRACKAGGKRWRAKGVATVERSRR